MNTTQKELRARATSRQAKYDDYTSKRGQAEAKRYLRSKEQAPTTGNLRAAIAFIIFAAAVLLIGMAL
jgi:lipase chaperone LimK